MTQARPTTRPRTKVAARKAATQAGAAPTGPSAASPETLAIETVEDTADNPGPDLGSEAALALVPARLTKGARLLEMLAAPDGSTLTSLCQALSWQAHTVRAALTRLRQAGHTVERSKTSEGEMAYHIAASQSAEGEAALQVEQPEAGLVAEAKAASPAPLAPEALDGGAA